MSTVICSHGFGVRADGRGLFSEISLALENPNFITFDYNQIDEAGNVTVTPVDEQAEKLTEKIRQAPEGSTLLCHSQGCIVAALADTTGIKAVIFLAPPVELDIPRFIQKFDRHGAVFRPDGTSTIPRRDGTTTYIPPGYMKSIEDLDVSVLYSDLADRCELTIIRATADEILGNIDFGFLEGKAKIIDIDGNHDFRGEARQELIKTLRNEAFFSDK